MVEVKGWRRGVGVKAGGGVGVESQVGWAGRGMVGAQGGGGGGRRAGWVGAFAVGVPNRTAPNPMTPR